MVSAGKGLFQVALEAGADVIEAELKDIEATKRTLPCLSAI